MNKLEPPLLEMMDCQRQLPPGHTPYSSKHPRKHGFVPQLALSNEESGDFYSLERSLYDEYRPTCATESLLLDELTLNYWRLQRARVLEANLLGEDRENRKLLALYNRYRIGFERSFFRALQLLRKVKAENTNLIAQYSACQFVPQTRRNRREPDAQAAETEDRDFPALDKSA